MQCEVDINECESAPCLNGGVCEDGVAGYVCHCAEAEEGLLPWGGPQCSAQMLGCVENTCENGATCVPRFDGETHGHTCLCPPGFYGDVCSTPTTFSFSSPRFFLFEVPSLERRRRDTKHGHPLGVRLRFRTTLPDMMLFFRGNAETFLSLEIVGGELRTRVASGVGGPLEARLPGVVSDGDWREVVAGIDEEDSAKLVLEVKGPACEIKACRVENKFPDDGEPFLNHESFTKVYVGGVPEEYLKFTLSGRGFLGCMEDLQVDGRQVLPHDLGDGDESVEIGCKKTEWCEVDPQPCSQHGQCVDLWTSYRCDCHRPHYGHECSQGQHSHTAEMKPKE